MERTVLEKLCSSDFPFIVHLIYAFQSDTKLHLVMDYVPGGELFSHLCKRRFFPVESARVLLGELALALKFIHSHNIVYRDLKLENIMIDQQGHVSLITGFSKTKHPPSISIHYTYNLARFFNFSCCEIFAEL
jgi:serine/threonine protein kinase